ncbi:MAG TPA: acyl-CoA thioesterase [Planctomycetota bacterium]|nr:acyl-CoA thioesterase [Planctomycetota bacterium]
MKPSESTLLVRPEHLNHHGYLFGGRLLEWLDEQAYISAMSLLKPEANLVTVAIDRVVFNKPVKQGSLLRFRSLPVHAGRTSLTVFTQVFLLGAAAETEMFSAYVTFVCLGARERPRAVAPLMVRSLTYASLDSDQARRHWEEVERARRLRAKRA